MPSKRENLVQSIRVVQQLLRKKSSLHSTQEQISQELDRILDLSMSGKLTLEILSCFSELTQIAYSCLTYSSTILELYHFKRSPIPNVLLSPNFNQSNSTFSIVLQPNSAIGQPMTYYTLSPKSSILIGRDQQRLKTDLRSKDSILISLADYKKVSSVHARIIPNLGSDSNCLTWQICDLDSRNGTYVNGKQISSCQPLQAGDLITLAYSVASEKSPGFIFESKTENVLEQNTVFESDIICLVINNQQQLSAEEKQIIDQISNSPISVLIIIVDSSNSSPQSLQQLDSELERINSWVKIQYPKIYEITEVISLDLQQFLLLSQKNASDSTNQQKLKEFHTSLVDFYKNRAEEVLSSRLTKKFFLQIEQVEHFLNVQLETLRWELQEAEAKLQGKSLDDWREYFKEVFRTINDQRQDFIYQVKTDLSRAKIDFSTSFIPGNLMQKIELFIEKLKPYVERKSGQICIQLKTDDEVAVHQAIIKLCQTELLQWGNEQWRQVCWSYGMGGLNELSQRSYALLSPFSFLKISHTFIEPKFELNFEKDLSKSFIEAQTNSSFLESPDNTLVNAAVLGFKATLALGMLFLDKPIEAARHGSRAADGLSKLVGSRLSQAQLQQRNLDQTVNSLKRSVCAYYQNIAKYLIEQLVQNINRALDNEDRHFRKELEEINQQITICLAELRRCTDEYKTHQSLLNQDKAVLEQIKSFLV